MPRNLVEYGAAGGRGYDCGPALGSVGSTEIWVRGDGASGGRGGLVAAMRTAGRAARSEKER